MAVKYQREHKNQYEYSISCISDDLVLPVVSDFMFQITRAKCLKRKIEREKEKEK